MPVGFLGVTFGTITAYMHEGDGIRAHGFLFGYDALVWTLVALQSLGGLMVALVIKFADNIVKGFATSASIVLACAISIFAFDFTITWQFAIGTAFVIASVWIYGRYPAKLSTTNTSSTNAMPLHSAVVANGHIGATQQPIAVNMDTAANS